VRVVGIGCSAGGLEALDAFFAHVAADSDLAYVVVQHLDPTRASSLPELLQRDTALLVCEATDGLAVQAGCVYVIPPNKDLALCGGRLVLSEPTTPRGQRLAVDFFFSSLALDQGEQAVGVLLSGMGSDGVQGLRAIKLAGGLVLVQDPASAQSASMPASAIEAGVADIVARPEDLAQRIGAPRPRDLAVLPEVPAHTAADKLALAQITGLLRERGGNDFSLYKPSTLVRRIERRMAVQAAPGIADYAQQLRDNPQELDLLFKEMLIGVTQFFRDPEVWESLRTELLPELLARHPQGHHFRAWVPACSSGEEAYSLAMVFSEVVAAAGSVPAAPHARYTLQVYATDLDPDAIDKARKGLYPKGIAGDVGAERLSRHFVEDEAGYRVAKGIRDRVIFAPQNVIQDPPFTKLDLLSCRNLLIYFRPELQAKLFPLFHYALNRDGLLLLGNAETVGSFSYLFAALKSQDHCFRRLDPSQLTRQVLFPAITPAQRSPETAVREAPAETLGQLTEQLILQGHAPAALLVNADGDILYISGRTGKYLEPAAGKVNINLHAMAREGLAEALTGVVQRALRDQQPVKLRGLKVGGNGSTTVVDVTVQPLSQPALLQGRALIVFKDVAPPPVRRRTRKSAASAAHEALLQELQQAREALRTLQEGSQSALEELKSANEELQSTNEELQSTNEELTTSKEEMQSMNEEMQTVNAELQARVKDFTWERNDMTNLLNSTEIATIFLDGEMKLRRYTTLATQLFKLIPGDVGRPLSDLVSELDYPQLKADAHEVLRSLVFCEKQVRTHDGRWFRVRTMPYRTQDNVIDGVVSTFVNITETKALEAELRLRAPRGKTQT
jgi:chemotaxis methyl-accepting protein methylase